MTTPRDAAAFRRTASYRLKRNWGRFSKLALAVLAIILFPLRVLRSCWRAAEAAGRAIILGGFRFMLGLFGMVVVGWFCLALVRVLFHPLFKR